MEIEHWWPRWGVGSSCWSTREQRWQRRHDDSRSLEVCDSTHQFYAWVDVVHNPGVFHSRLHRTGPHRLADRRQRDDAWPPRLKKSQTYWNHSHSTDDALNVVMWTNVSFSDDQKLTFEFAALWNAAYEGNFRWKTGPLKRQLHSCTHPPLQIPSNLTHFCTSCSLMVNAAHILPFWPRFLHQTGIPESFQTQLSGLRLFIWKMSFFKERERERERKRDNIHEFQSPFWHDNGPQTNFYLEWKMLFFREERERQTDRQREREVQSTCSYLRSHLRKHIVLHCLLTGLQALWSPVQNNHGLLWMWKRHCFVPSSL